MNLPNAIILINLIAKAAQDLDYSVTMDFADALHTDDHIFGCILPIHIEDLADYLIHEAGYLSFEDAAEDYRLGELAHIDSQLHLYAR